MLTPGDVIAGRFRIRKPLAEGGFGAVFVAEHVETERLVALKVLWPHVLESRDAVEKFKLEARLAARIQSEHVVQVLDAGFDEARKAPFLAMELLQGRTLEHLVEHKGPLSPDECVSLLAQVAKALDKAHQLVDREGRHTPVIHRDLKPENLFFTRRESGEPCIKVLDFGIAKVLSETTKMSRDVKGTPLFMAFEQATGNPVSPQTDIWALGLIAYYLLTGRHYWRTASKPDSTMHALFGEILAMPLDSPSARLVEVGGVCTWPPGFDAWFSKCVNREPNQRFRTAGVAIDELAEVFGMGDPTLAAPRLIAARAVVASRVSGPALEELAATVAPSAPPPARIVSAATPAPVTQGGSVLGVFRRYELPAALQGHAAQTASPLSRSQPIAPPAQGARGALIGIVLAVVVAGGLAAAFFAGRSGGNAPAPATPSSPVVVVKESASAAPSARPSDSAAPTVAPAIASSAPVGARPTKPQASAAAQKKDAPSTPRTGNLVDDR